MQWIIMITIANPSYRFLRVLLHFPPIIKHYFARIWKFWIVEQIKWITISISLRKHQKAYFAFHIERFGCRYYVAFYCKNIEYSGFSECFENRKWKIAESTNYDLENDVPSTVNNCIQAKWKIYHCWAPSAAR